MCENSVSSGGSREPFLGFCVPGWETQKRGYLLNGLLPSILASENPGGPMATLQAPRHKGYLPWPRFGYSPISINSLWYS